MLILGTKGLCERGRGVGFERGFIGLVSVVIMGYFRIFLLRQGGGVAPPAHTLAHYYPCLLTG